MSSAAGWYPDPTRRFELRYHNGHAWTADVATDGDRFVDPLGTRPGPVPASTPPASPAATPGGGRNGAATASMVLGIIAVALGWLPFVVVVGAIAAVLALVLGFTGRRRARASGVGGAFALTGLITGAVGAVVCVAGVLFTAAILQAFDRFENPEPHSATITSCTRSGDEVTALGELTNLGDDAADFSVRVHFVRAGTDNPQRQALVELDEVAPGTARSFEVTRAVSLAAVDCIVGSVRGALPYGIDPGT